ncbi:DNA repair protein RAD51 homolog 2 isoform X2 [Procambarus clarkii]|uniref:DNA repair protein RAD51 homolog 2 isoform X2 n=1 Tax=Procambarus clarkii TaxID=6728 RepID=UPI001E67264A|nr:DNA repair protein RAD51 homolog 2-like isoform X4 [Procambarus clarkii]
MAFMRLAKLPIDQDLKDRIARSSLKTVKDVLSLPPLQVMTLLNMSADECKLFMDKLFNVCIPKHVTAFDLSEEERKGSYWLGTDTLDSMLHGGLHAGSLTEFAGPSGVGKTQWCLYIAILTVIAKRDSSNNITTMYIDTETAFRPERLESLEVIAVEKDVGLLIVDSIASLARKEITSSSSLSNIARTNQLASWAAKLKCLAQQLNICVVVTNQVTTQVAKKELHVTEEIHSLDEEDGELHTGSRERTFSRHVTPALGNTWTHCVNTRFILQFKDSKTRQLIIAKSPIAPFATFNYTIGERGINIEEHEGFYSYSGSDPGLHKIKVQQGIIL